MLLINWDRTCIFTSDPDSSSATSTSFVTRYDDPVGTEWMDLVDYDADEDDKRWDEDWDKKWPTLLTDDDRSSPNYFREVARLHSMAWDVDNWDTGTKFEDWAFVTHARISKRLRPDESSFPSSNSPHFDLFRLPAELIPQVLDALGSGFFRKDVSRLTVSKTWYRWALPAMYRDFDASKTRHPFAPISRCFEHGWDYDKPSTAAGPCKYSANEQFSPKIRETLLKYTCILRVNVDLALLNMYREPRFKWSDDMVHGLHDPAGTRHHIYPPASCQTFDQRVGGELCAPLSWPSHAVQLLQTAPHCHTLDVCMKETWGYDPTGSAFDHVVGEAIKLQNHVSTLYLDLAGLTPTESSWFWARHNRRVVNPVSELQAYEGDTPADIEERRKSLAKTGPATARNGQQSEDAEYVRFRHPLRGLPYHFCHAIRESLPQLERLHVRLPNLCASMFRDLRAADDAVPSLPKLKEVVINLALPDDSAYVQNRTCHCIASGNKCPPETVQKLGDLLAQNMKDEVIRLVKRMYYPTKVLVRYPRPKRSFYVDRRYVNEWDGLTGETRLRAIDGYGIVKN